MLLRTSIGVWRSVKCVTMYRGLKTHSFQSFADVIFVQHPHGRLLEGNERSVGSNANVQSNYLNWTKRWFRAPLIASRRSLEIDHCLHVQMHTVRLYVWSRAEYRSGSAPNGPRIWMTNEVDYSEKIQI